MRPPAVVPALERTCGAVFRDAFVYEGDESVHVVGQLVRWTAPLSIRDTISKCYAEWRRETSLTSMPLTGSPGYRLALVTGVPGE